MRGEEIVAPRPRIDGGEAATLLGIAPGPELGRALAALVEAQVRGSVSSDDEARDLGHGKKLALPEHPDAEPVAAIDASGRLVALISVRRGVGRTLVGFPPDGE